MEANSRKTNATVERSTGNCAGTLELWDGDFAFLWVDLRFKQSGIVDGYKRK